MPSIPELAMIDLLNSLVDRVIQTAPAQTSGKPLYNGCVYSQLIVGMPVDPEDYANPWSPMGGDSASASAPGVTPASGTPDPKLLVSLEAAFKTSQLCNIMLQVTDDGSYLQYPTGRHLDFQYTGILGSMTALPSQPLPANEQAALNAAMNVLYTFDTTDPANPVISGKSPLYARYVKNANDYAAAKSSYATNMALTLANPATANLWPMISAPYQQRVDDAWDLWKTEGADTVEAALAAYESQGINMQQSQIAKAKSQHDIWSLGLAGVPTDIPYSYLEPSEWWNPDADDIGFEDLIIQRKTSTFAADTTSKTNKSMYWNKQQTSTTVNAHAGFSIIGNASGSTTSADQHSANGDASNYTTQAVSSDDIEDLTIELEWAVVSINRPGLISDLFYMDNWYIPGEPAGCISNGTIETQANSTEPLLPMIPQQMLVIRNVRIQSDTWGDHADTLNTLYGTDQASTDASQTSYAASGGFSYGPISAGGGTQHSKSTSAGQSSGYTASDAVSNHGATFDGNTLEIKGAQIIAFISDIVPFSPLKPDPTLPKQDTTSTQDPTAVATAPVGVEVMQS